MSVPAPELPSDVPVHNRARTVARVSGALLLVMIASHAWLFASALRGHEAMAARFSSSPLTGVLGVGAFVGLIALHVLASVLARRAPELEAPSTHRILRVATGTLLTVFVGLHIAHLAWPRWVGLVSLDSHYARLVETLGLWGYRVVYVAGIGSMVVHALTGWRSIDSRTSPAARVLRFGLLLLLLGFWLLGMEVTAFFVTGQAITGLLGGLR